MKFARSRSLALSDPVGVRYPMYVKSHVGIGEVVRSTRRDHVPMAPPEGKMPRRFVLTEAGPLVGPGRQSIRFAPQPPGNRACVRPVTWRRLRPAPFSSRPSRIPVSHSLLDVESNPILWGRDPAVTPSPPNDSLPPGAPPSNWRSGSESEPPLIAFRTRFSIGAPEGTPPSSAVGRTVRQNPTAVRSRDFGGLSATVAAHIRSQTSSTGPAAPVTIATWYTSGAYRNANMPQPSRTGE